MDVRGSPICPASRKRLRLSLASPGRLRWGEIVGTGAGHVPQERRKIAPVARKCESFRCRVSRHSWSFLVAAARPGDARLAAGPWCAATPSQYIDSFTDAATRTSSASFLDETIAVRSANASITMCRQPGGRRRIEFDAGVENLTDPIRHGSTFLDNANTDATIYPATRAVLVAWPRVRVSLIGRAMERRLRGASPAAARVVQSCGSAPRRAASGNEDRCASCRTPARASCDTAKSARSRLRRCAARPRSPHRSDRVGPAPRGASAATTVCRARDPAPDDRWRVVWLRAGGGRGPLHPRLQQLRQGNRRIQHGSSSHSASGCRERPRRRPSTPAARVRARSVSPCCLACRERKPAPAVVYLG